MLRVGLFVARFIEFQSTTEHIHRRHLATFESRADFFIQLWSILQLHRLTGIWVYRAIPLFGSLIVRLKDKNPIAPLTMISDCLFVLGLPQEILPIECSVDVQWAHQFRCLIFDWVMLIQHLRNLDILLTYVAVVGTTQMTFSIGSDGYSLLYRICPRWLNSRGVL
jgi:hypothetical protein